MVDTWKISKMCLSGQILTGQSNRGSCSNKNVHLLNHGVKCNSHMLSKGGLVNGVNVQKQYHRLVWRKPPSYFWIWFSVELKNRLRTFTNEHSPGIAHSFISQILSAHYVSGTVLNTNMTQGPNTSPNPGAT